MPNYDLLTLDEAKDLLGITDTTDDQRITRLIPMASRRLEVYLNNFVLQRPAIVEKLSGGVKRWYLERYPVASIASIEDGAGNALTEALSYQLFAQHGVLQSRHGAFPRAVESDGRTGQWTVTYAAGRFDDLGTVDAEFKEATALLLIERFERPEPGVTSRKVGDLSVTYSTLGDGRLVPPEVEALVGTYVSRTV